MAYNLQNISVPDIQEVFERSRNEWLEYEDINAILEIHEELVRSTEPANPDEEGIYLYEEDDTLDLVEWDDEDETPNAMFGEVPITYTIAHCNFFIDPTVVSGRVLSTLERRVYKAETYGKFLLAHYRSMHTGDNEHEEEDNEHEEEDSEHEEEDNEEEDSEEEDSEDEDSNSSDSRGDEDWNEAGEDDVAPEDGEHHPVYPADAAAAWSIDLGGDNHASDVAPVANLDLSVPSPSPSLCLMDKSETSSQTKDSYGKETGEEVKDEQEDTVTENTDLEENVTVARSKKDPLLRRQELLVNSGHAERLIDACVENAEEFLKSNVDKEAIYEVARGGADGILTTKSKVFGPQRESKA